MYDLVKNKSQEMQALSREFGFREILLVSKDSAKTDCFFLDNAKDYRKEIQKARKKFDAIIVKGNPKENRKIVEASPDILLSPHSSGKKDFMRERNSGLNQIICKIAAEKKVVVGIDFNEVLQAENRELIIGRIMQNIKLCRKYKVKMLLASFASGLLELRDAQDLIAFAQTIGMTPEEAKESLKVIWDIINRNREKKSPEYVAEGIRIVE